MHALSDLQPIARASGAQTRGQGKPGAMVHMVNTAHGAHEAKRT